MFSASRWIIIMYVFVGIMWVRAMHILTSVGCRCAKWKSLCRCLVNLVAGCVTTFRAHCWSVGTVISLCITLCHIFFVFIVWHLCRHHEKKWTAVAALLRVFQLSIFISLFFFSLFHAECRVLCAVAFDGDTAGALHFNKNMLYVPRLFSLNSYFFLAFCPRPFFFFFGSS